MNRKIYFAEDDDLVDIRRDNVFKAVASGQVDLSPIITNKFALDQCEEGIKYMKESPDDKIKGIVLID